MAGGAPPPAVRAPERGAGAFAGERAEDVRGQLFSAFRSDDQSQEHHREV